MLDTTIEVYTHFSVYAYTLHIYSVVSQPAPNLFFCCVSRVFFSTAILVLVQVASCRFVGEIANNADTVFLCAHYFIIDDTSLSHAAILQGNW